MITKSKTRPVLPLLALALLAAACASSGSGPGSGQAGGPGKPKVDRLLIAMPPPGSEGNNPNVELTPLTVFQLRPMLEWLVGYSTDGKFEPMLATGWSVEPDGKSLRFKLRQGVPFHNGVGEFTAKDAVYSFQQMVREDSIHPHAPIHRTVQVEVVSDYEVLFKLRNPNAEYLNQLSRLSGSLAITSKADADVLGHNASLANRPLASTGPYQFNSREVGRSVTFDRVPYKHYRAIPDFPQIEMRWVPEASTRLAALLTEEVHVTQLPQDLTPQAETKGFKLIRGPITEQRTWLGFYGVYLKDPVGRSKEYMYPEVALADVRVRKALNKAIDRDALNKAFFAGKAEPMVMDKMHRSKPYFNSEWEKNFPKEYGYDPDAARGLLAQAGYGPSKPLKLKIRLQNLPDYGGSQDVQEAIAEMWRKAGVETELAVIQDTEFRNVNDKFGWKDLVNVNASSSFDIQAWRVYNSSLPPRGALEHHEVDPLVHELSQTMDEKRQQELLRRLGDVALPLHLNIPLFWLPAELIVNPGVVAAWPYPGSISRIFSHFETIKAAS